MGSRAMADFVRLWEPRCRSLKSNSERRSHNLGAHGPLWIGVKGQANSVIAGSPRNAFRCSVACSAMEVEHWMG